MQEILFRGFHKQADGPDFAIIDGVMERGKWVYGYYACATEEHGLEQHLILVPDFDLGYFDHVRVELPTVGAYTGLTDKNGKKIFEGDIISGRGTGGTQDSFPILWSDAFCGFTAGHGKSVWPNLNQATVSAYEVIGTIYDAPPEGA